MLQAKRPRLVAADQTTTATDLEPVSEEAAHRELLELQDSGLSVSLPRFVSPPAKLQGCSKDGLQRIQEK